MFALRQIVNRLVLSGHKEHDVIWEYSIEKATRYYEDLIEADHIEFFRQTIRDFNVALSTIPAQSRGHAQKQQSHWKGYIDSIRPEVIMKKKKKNPLEKLIQTGEVT
jgi:hypothetical protein